MLAIMDKCIYNPLVLRLYSRGCEYALRALMHFPPREQGHVSILDLARDADIPLHFARKMFHTLVHEGVLEAVTGPGGGYRLARAPGDIHLLEVVQIIDGEDAFNDCVLGFKVCRDQTPCALHPMWMKAKRTLVKELGDRTLKDLLESQPTDRRHRAQAKKRD